MDDKNEGFAEQVAREHYVRHPVEETGYFRAKESDVGVTIRDPDTQVASMLPMPKLPAMLAPLRMRDHTGKDAYTLFVGRALDEYEKWVAHVGQTSDIGEMCYSLLQGKGTLIDLGAALGWVSVPIAITGSQVVAIEMNPTNCLRLNHAIRENHLPNMKLVQTAVSDFDGFLRFHGDAAWGHISDEPGGKEVLCQRVDSIMYEVELAAELPSPVVMKIDVERHEHVVFAGSTEFIKKHRPIILFESIEKQGDATDEGNSRAAKRIISEMGYHLFIVMGNVLAPKALGDSQEGHVSDYLAVPEEKVSDLSKLPYAVRALTEAEILERFRVDAVTRSRDHDAHTEGLLELWRRESPELAEKAQAIKIKSA
jgi:FkbM family methyltransferase